MMAAGVSLIGSTPGQCCDDFIRSEDPNGTAPIAVATDIVGATIMTGLEVASLSLGTVTGPSTLLFRRQMTNMGTMTGEGGGGGVSDVLSLFSFAPPPVDLTPVLTVGFLATFQSDSETGISPPPGKLSRDSDQFAETGSLQHSDSRRFHGHITGAGDGRFGGKRPIRCGGGRGRSGTASWRSSTFRHRPRRVGSARLAQEAEGASSRLIKNLIGFRRDRREAVFLFSAAITKNSASTHKAS